MEGGKGELLGRGAYAEVIREGDVAVKRPRSRGDALTPHRILKETRRMLRDEAAIMASLDHPNIVRMLPGGGGGGDENEDSVHIRMEYLPGRDMFRELYGDDGEAVRCVSEAEAVHLFRQVVEGLTHCHEMGIYHGDMKPENIMVLPGEPRTVKLIDFGLSERFVRGGKPRRRDIKGTPNYTSPEAYRREPYLGPESDVWALGIILHEMIYGRLPFRCDDVPSLAARVSACRSDPLSRVSGLGAPVGHELLDLMDGLLKFKEERLTLPEVRGHPWLRESAAGAGSSN